MVKLHLSDISTSFPSNSQQKKKPKQSQTKNIILNYRSIMKKIVKKTKSKHFYKEISTAMQKTSKPMIQNVLYQNSAFRELLIESMNNGYFLRTLMLSKMNPKNKSYCLKFLNILYNSFNDPSFLTKWVDFKDEKGKKQQQKVGRCRDEQDEIRKDSDQDEQYEYESMDYKRSDVLQNIMENIQFENKMKDNEDVYLSDEIYQGYLRL